MIKISDLIQVLEVAKKEDGDLPIAIFTADPKLTLLNTIGSGVYLRMQNEEGKWISQNTLCLSSQPGGETEEEKTVKEEL